MKPSSLTANRGEGMFGFLDFISIIRWVRFTRFMIFFPSKKNSIIHLIARAFSRLALLVLAGLSIANAFSAAESGTSVVVVYNLKMPESKEIAQYYAQRRGVPSNQVFGFELPLQEEMTRSDFVQHLQKPLSKSLEAHQLFSFTPAGGQQKLIGATIRYAVLCYGVPTKILADPTLVEPEAEKVPAELRRNEAAVDSQLACLPLSEQKFIWAGPYANQFFGATNANFLHPTNGILMVARLDGPTAAIARGLVDKALEAETNGLWGRAYFDARGLTNGDYRMGDEWIHVSATIAQRNGFETVLDDTPNTFPVGFPMSQIALYAGWYDWNVSGPFTLPTVEFMPGAFAYHLHSFSAQVLRSSTQNWVGPLLSKGATITLGCVNEPYLMGTPNTAAFLERFLAGFSFGEAAYSAQKWLSWQTTVVGDPLYRPFNRSRQEQYNELENRHSKLVEWAHLRLVNMNLAAGKSASEMGRYLEQISVTRHSALLKEKLADLYWSTRQFSDAFDTYDEALKLDPTPQQKIRLILSLAQKRYAVGSDRAAADLYQRLIKDFPNYPDLLTVYQKLLPLVQKLGQKDQVERCQQEIQRLTPAAPSAASAAAASKK